MAAPDVVAGMRPDASLMFSNPAVVADVSRGQVFLTTANWLDGLNLSAASIALPLGQTGLRWAFGSRLLYAGDLQGFDASNEVIATESFYDFTATTGLSKRFHSIGLAVGADVTYLREHMPIQDGNGFTFSAGLSYQYRAHRVDFFARDIGGSIKFADRDYPIDSRYTVGYGYMLNRSWGRLNLGSQLTIARSAYQRLEVGATYFLGEYVSLSSGLDHAFAAPTNSQMPVSAGLGVHYAGVSLDYAFTSQEYFDNTHTFSLNVAFGRDAGSYLDEMGLGPAPTEVSPAAAAAAPARKDAVDEQAQVYDVIAGIHNRLESARAEVRALRLVKVPAVVDEVDGSYRVRVARFDSLDAAKSALSRYEKAGHRFNIVAHSS